MLIVVDPHSGVPVYRQVMDQIKFHIASGILRAGDELPSTRSLSAELGVNPMTISKAYSYLERDEVVERRPGRPLVVKESGAGATRKRPPRGEPTVAVDGGTPAISAGPGAITGTMATTETPRCSRCSK